MEKGGRCKTMKRPINAQERISARYIPAGYTVYKEMNGGIVYASADKLHGIAFRGTAMNHEWNYRFRDPASLDQECDRFFGNLKAHQEFKKSRKLTRDKGETDTQKVKKALKAAGYNVTSVTRGTGTASDWIEIRIDDYESVINERGDLDSQYGKVLWIAQVASGREDLHDDIQTDLFMVNISVNFSKYHRCAECVISNCDKYHTPESGACGGFLSQEMANIHYAIWSAPVFPPYINPDNYLFAEVA